MMKLAVALFVVVAVASAVDPTLDARCQEWVVTNQKDMILLNQVASQSHISTCQQYCMVAGSGFRSDTVTCRVLCEAAGGYNKFSESLGMDEGLAAPDALCKTMLAPKLEEPVSMLEVASAAVNERKLGVRGDMTVQGTLTTSILTSPVGDVKVSGELNVMNQIEATTARAAFLKADGGVSIKSGIKCKKDQLLIKGRIDADTVTMDSLSASSFLEIDGVRQWSLHSLEDFEEVGVDGWNKADITSCAGRKILGGHCVNGEKGTSATLSKTFTGLPAHDQMRINAQYMFIDSWDGESGYLKVDGNILWTEAYSHTSGEKDHGINLCGNETPERKFVRPVDVTIPHTGDSITLEFGSTTDEHACDESFGIDSVMLFTR